MYSTDTPNCSELRRVISLLPYPVFYLKGSSFTIALANQAQLLLWNMQAEMVEHKAFFQLFSDGFYPGFKKAAHQAVETADGIVLPEVMVNPMVPGAVANSFRIEIKPVKDNQDELTGFLCTAIPVSSGAKQWRGSADRYYHLFENTRVSQWDEDYSKVKAELERLQEAGIRDLDDYFTNRPEELHRLVNLVTIRGVNEATMQLLGGTREELLTGLAHFFVADTMPAFQEQLKVIAAGGGAYEHETVIRCKDGRLANVQVLIYFPGGDDYSIVPVTLLDVTEQKAAEAALRKSEERLRTFVAHAPVAIAMLDRNMCYMAASDQWIQSYHLERNIVGLSHYEVFPGLPVHWKEIHQSALSGKVERSEEDRLVRADGSVQWLKWEVRPWNDLQGNTGGIIIYSEDISERKKAEEAVKESEARFRKIADHAPVMIWVTDEKGYCHYLNQQWYDFTGQSEAEGLGLGWTNAVHPDEQEKAASTFMEASNKQLPYRLEFRLRKWDGTYEWVIDSAVPRYDEQGVFLGYTGSVVNIHQRKLAEDVLQKLNLHFELSTNSAGVGTWSLDLATSRVEWSLLHNRMWGYKEPLTDLSYADWYQVILPEDRDLALAQVEHAKINRTRYEMFTGSKEQMTTPFVGSVLLASFFITKKVIQLRLLASASTSPNRRKRKKHCGRVRKDYAPSPAS